jgi:hypothetical protein
MYPLVITQIGNVSFSFHEACKRLGFSPRRLQRFVESTV